VSAKNGVMVGSFMFLQNWMIRAEKKDALQKIFIKNFKTEKPFQVVKLRWPEKRSKRATQYYLPT